MRQVAIIKSGFNKDLVEELYKAAFIEFKAVSKKQSQNQNEMSIKPLWVPGAGEIPQAVQWLLERESKIKKSSSKDQTSREPLLAGVLALGVIIRGKTPHFDFLKDFLQTSLWDLQKRSSAPIVFSVLMLENRTQFKDRVIRANEGMKALLKMISLKQQLCHNN